MIFYKNVYLHQGDEFILKDFAIEDGCFLFSNIEDDCEVIDMNYQKIIPGLIDIHSHGAKGVDFNNIDKKAVEEVCSYFYSQGVVGVYPTLLTDDKDVIIKSIQTLVESKESGADSILGIHIEGPFICEEFKACMPSCYLRLPDKALFDEFYDASKGLFQIMTMSAELEGASDLVKHAVKKGVVISLGHSGANGQQAQSFIDAGASNATHLGNAMKQPTQHDLFVCGTVLNSDIYSEIICDGAHINKTVVQYWFKVRPHNKMILVTDSIMATGLSDGEYRLGINEVIVENKHAWLKHARKTRAGSTLTAIEAVRNLSQFLGLPFVQCVKFMSENPAKALSIFDRVGSIEEGKEASFVVLDDQYEVLETYLKGNCVYKK
ncbi:N-acetylglucosamine-6-phosphate deacetylase [Tannockella kyphosi]|uniref:N-acetylglucosamine-6-phosphate deacetylase n=1 Tax=Tannockella kyphosi TaxID=2899121 RepID=UPI002012D737|nr:N-acetylglucosamine-6-phosphate deacetylase [Tannockella kyphosi]